MWLLNRRWKSKAMIICWDPFFGWPLPNLSLCTYIEVFRNPCHSKKWNGHNWAHQIPHYGPHPIFFFFFHPWIDNINLSFLWHYLTALYLLFVFNYLNNVLFSATLFTIISQEKPIFWKYPNSLLRRWTSLNWTQGSYHPKFKSHKQMKI